MRAWSPLPQGLAEAAQISRDQIKSESVCASLKKFLGGGAGGEGWVEVFFHKESTKRKSKVQGFRFQNLCRWREHLVA